MAVCMMFLPLAAKQMPPGLQGKFLIHVFVSAISLYIPVSVAGDVQEILQTVCRNPRVFLCLPSQSVLSCCSVLT
jgi:hypothetical protein